MLHARRFISPRIRSEAKSVFAPSVSGFDPDLVKMVIGSKVIMNETRPLFIILLMFRFRK